MAKAKYWNGTSWQPLDAGDADTLDGKHAATTLTTTEKNDLAGAINEVKSSVDSHLADYEYKPATVVGTQIRVQKQSDTAIVKFRLNNDVTGGFITISLDGGVTSKPLKNIDGEDITELEKGFVEVIEDATNFTLRPRGGDLEEFFGDGSDGVLDTNSDVILECAQDAPLIKQYKSIKINAGHTLTTNDRCARLILYSQSDVVIDGIIDMSKKGWRYSIRNNSLPAVIYGRNKIAPTPVGGDGGNGGKGGSLFQGGEGNIGGRGTTLGSGKGGGGGGGGSEANSASGSALATGGRGGSVEFTYTNDYNLAGRGSGGYASVSEDKKYDNGGNAINSGGGGGAATANQRTAAYAQGGSGGYGYWAGGGGGGGAASTAPRGASAESGGNGENGGGNVVIIAKGNVITGVGGKILCNGGNGGNGGAGRSDESDDYSAYGSGGGGGGGAGGGTIVILHKGTFINNGELSVAGGLGGSGGSGSPLYAGQNGTSGTVGTIIVQQITD